MFVFCRDKYFTRIRIGVYDFYNSLTKYTAKYYRLQYKIYYIQNKHPQNQI